MGETFTGGVSKAQDAQLLTPQQQQFMSNLNLPGLGQQAGQAYSNFLQPYDPAQYQDLFQRGILDPAMQNYEQQILPAIQQRFGGGDTSTSSALNQALAQSASNLSTGLGSQYLDFYKQQQANQLSALGGAGGMATQQTTQPIYQQSQGVLGPLIGAAGTLGGGALSMSSEKVKENIKEYKKGINELQKFKVKMYDYIEEVGGQKDKIGLIAEDLPTELTAEKDGILHVDLYALMSVMINSIQDLNRKLVNLGAK